MKIINKPCKINSPLSQSNTFKDWFYLATEKYENNIAYIKKDNLGRNHNIVFYKVKRHVSFLAYSHIEEKLTNEKVIIIGRNSYEWIVSYLSLLITGTTAVPLDAGLKEEEIENSISRITPALVICDSTKLELIKTIKEKLNLKFKIYLTEKDDKTEEENILTIDDVIANVKETTTFKKVLEAIDNLQIDENATKILLFTSGTTSQSKIVELSNKNIISNLKAIQAVIPVTNKDTTLALLPFHHTFGIIGVLVVLFSGGTIAFVESMKKFKDNIKEYSPTLLFLVPAVLELVYKKIQSGIKKSGKEELVKKMIKISNKLLEFNIDIRRLLFRSIINELGGKIKFAFSGAAPIKKELIEAYENFGIHIFQGYGMTETSPVISAENYCKKNPGSVGFPMPNVTVKIDKPDENGIGEILIQGDNVFKGYMNDKEKTDEVIIDNWCHTGDIGYIDENGFIFITGRQKDMIVLDNGKKIFPEEIEHVLMDLEYIKDVLVYADNSLGDDDLKLTAKIKIDKKEIQQTFKNLEYNQILDKIWNDIKEINTTFPKYKYIKDVLVTEEDFIKTTTLKIKRFKEIEKTKEELENGKTISIKNISTKEK